MEVSIVLTFFDVIDILFVLYFVQKLVKIEFLSLLRLTLTGSFRIWYASLIYLNFSVLF